MGHSRLGQGVFALAKAMGLRVNRAESTAPNPALRDKAAHRQLLLRYAFRTSP